MINIPHHTAKINISKIGFKTNLTHKSKKNTECSQFTF